MSPRTTALRGQVDQYAEADDRADPLGAQLRPARRPGGGPDAVVLREAARMAGTIRGRFSRSLNVGRTTSDFDMATVGTRMAGFQDKGTVRTLCTLR